MSKPTLHFQQFVPADVRKNVQSLRGSALTFGPHARQRWAAKFGGIEKPTALPLDAEFLEIVLKPVDDGPALDTILFRYKLDEFTDCILSVVYKTKFVCSVWRVPRWYGKGAGRPTDPSKYLTEKTYRQLCEGGAHAA
jgi:hypothetical protein